jgi:hypothetical protein
MLGGNNMLYADGCEKVFAVDRRVYYTGDSGNQSGFGIISKHNPFSDDRGFTVDIEMDDGRVFSCIPPSDFGRLDGYGEIAGCHFVFKEDYLKYYQRNVESERVRTAKTRIRALIRKTQLPSYSI